MSKQISIALLACALSGVAYGTDEQWFAVMLNGAKTGHMQASRTERHGIVTTEQTMLLSIERMGISIQIENREQYVESVDGRPMSFEAVQKTSGVAMRTKGSINEDGTLTITSGTPGSERTRTMPWPEGALLAEGQRLAILEAGLEPGSQFAVSAFVPSAMESITVDNQVLAKESIDLFGREVELLRVDQTMKLGLMDTKSVAWVDDQFELHKMSMDMMGLTLDIMSCPEQCALSDNEPTEFFVSALAKSPSAITQPMTEAPLVYTVSARSSDAKLYFPDSDEQDVINNNGVWTLKIGAQSPGPQPIPYAGENPAAQAALQPTDWIQSSAPEVLALAKTATEGAKTAAEAMQRLESFVSDYVNEKSLSVGYASALEVIDTRAGDCTEHALLLAALGRAIGVPTRIATGLAYVDQWVGVQDTFVPHAWVQAYIGDRWISYDAALGGFDTGHIALAYGDGDPWKFYDGALTLGNLQVDEVRAAP